MVETGESNQITGLRFDGVDIPAGKKIHKATIEFTAREYETPESNLIFYGQDSDDAGTFNAVTDDIGNRPRTTARVEWNDLAAWQRTEPRTKYLSEDLSSIVQEIIDRAGWEIGNGMVFMVEGLGRRTAYAYDHGIEDPAALLVLYCDTADIGDEVWVDLNDNGVRDPGEPARAGVTVELWSSGDDGGIGGDIDQLVASTISGNQGYGFRDLQNGSCYVEFVRPNNSRYSMAKQGDSAEIDSDADPNSGYSELIQFDGRRVTNIDAGFAPEPAAIDSNHTVSWISNLAVILPWLLIVILGAVILAALIATEYRRRNQVRG